MEWRQGMKDYLLYFCIVLLWIFILIQAREIKTLEANLQKLNNNLDSVTVNGEFKGYIIDKNYMIKTEKRNDREN
jgi:hypothetical protein